MTHSKPMSKTHKHKGPHKWSINTTWDRNTGGGVDVVCNIEECYATMDTTEAERILNRPAPRYRKVGAGEELSVDTQYYVKRIPPRKGKK